MSMGGEVVVKELTQALARSRFALRRMRSRLPLVSRGVEPVRMVLYLGQTPGGAASNDPPQLSLEQWKTTLVDLVSWLGPVRVCVDCTAGGEIELAMDLVRLAHRLECPTHLVTTGPVSIEQALELIDRGLGAVTLRVGGLDNRTHQLVFGGELDAVTASLSAFSKARALRNRVVVLQVNLTAHGENVSTLGAMAGWARQAGADSVVLGLLLGSPVPKGLLEAIQALPNVEIPSALARFIRGEGLENSGARVGLCANGDLVASLAMPPLGNVQEAPPEVLWAKSQSEIQSAIRHKRAFDEVELLPLDLKCRR